MDVKNWKLKELVGQYVIVGHDSITYVHDFLAKFGLPEKYNKHINRSETYIDWNKMPQHYKFFFDYEGNEEVGDLLSRSVLQDHKEIIITYGYHEPTIAISMRTFKADWEEIFSSTLYNSILHTRDCTLIMEITRDFYLHSNFKIK